MAVDFPHRTVQVRSWQEAKTYFGKFPEGWLFRGQRDATWSLESSLERIVPSSVNLAAFEGMVLDRFQRVAHHYLPSNRIPSDRLEWLALMQHHGAVTRLLDWTYSPYVAAFFAIERAESDCAVWVIGETKVKEAGRLLLLEENVNPSLLVNLASPKYHAAIFSACPLGVFPVEPYFRNQRLYIQQGLFLLGGDPSQGFTENLLRMKGLDTAQCVVKIVIPYDAKADALRDLNRVNVNRATLFPGLDGFAQSLGTYAELAFLKGTEPLFTSWLNNLPQDLGELYSPRGRSKAP